MREYLKRFFDFFISDPSSTAKGPWVSHMGVPFAPTRIEAEISSNSWGGHTESLALQQAIQVGIPKTEEKCGRRFFLLNISWRC